jgi:N utilization substance protein B
MGTRRKSRELALQMLFQSDMAGQNSDEVRRTFWSERKNVGEDVRGFADDLFRVAHDRASEIDTLIERHAEHWRMERMAAVDRNILRGGVAEFLAYPATPKAVIINEALEIARKFSSPDSVGFINGVLDGVARELDKKTA